MMNIWCISASFFCIFVSCSTAPTGVAKWKRPPDMLQSGIAQFFQSFSTTVATPIPTYSFEQLDVYGDYADAYDYNNTDFSDVNDTNAFYEQVNDTREATPTVTNLATTMTKNSVADKSILSFIANLLGTSHSPIDVITTRDSPTTQQMEILKQITLYSNESKVATYSTETASSSIEVTKTVKTDLKVDSTTSYDESRNVLNDITFFSTKSPKATNETLTTTVRSILAALPSSFSGTTNKSSSSMIYPPTESTLSLIKPEQLFTKTNVLSKVILTQNFSVESDRNSESVTQVNETTEPLLTRNSDVIKNKLNYDTTTLSNLNPTNRNVLFTETEKIAKNFFPTNKQEASTVAFSERDEFNVITERQENGRNRSNQDFIYKTSTEQTKTQSRYNSITTSAIKQTTERPKLVTTNIPEHGQQVTANQSFTTAQTTPYDPFSWIKNSYKGQESAIMQSTTSGFNWNLVTEDAYTKKEKDYEDPHGTNYSTLDLDDKEFTDDLPSLVAFKHDGLALTFFKKNWLWFFVGIIVVILLFVVPGMIVQICCNKYYIFYRREKSKQRNIEYPVQTSTSEPSKVSPSNTTVYQSEDIHSVTVPHNKQHEKETEKLASTSENSGHRRVEIYTGPCSLMSQNMLCASNEISSSPLATLNPLISTEKSSVCPALSNPQQPRYIYQERSPVLNNDDAEVNSVPVTNKKSLLSPLFCNEAIITSNPTDFERPALRVPKQTTNPVRPPKPKQYKSKTVPKSTNYQDCKRVTKAKRPWADNEQGPRRQVKSFRRQSTSSEFQRSDVQERSPVNNDGCHPPRTNKKNKLKSFKTREELLRQLVKGFNEAEILQRKLDRTRKLTNKQNTGVGGENSTLFDGTGSKNNVINRDSRKSHRKDRPPPYEDVMSAVSSKLKPSSRRHRR